MHPNQDAAAGIIIVSRKGLYQISKLLPAPQMKIANAKGGCASPFQSLP
ncbi:MAG: hypothetical protein NZ525_01130 [Rhodothermia bacterium]|nr:hypothetical protein [Rhodothermia bacterium]